MRKYLFKRFLLMFPTLLGVAVLIFVLIRIVPGDVVELRLAGDSSSVSEKVLAEERAKHGLDKPVVAAVRGPAVGIGFGLAMACDVVLASPSANFAQVFKRVGLAPDGGAIWFLARQIGFARAKELVFSARALGAGTMSP